MDRQDLHLSFHLAFLCSSTPLSFFKLHCLVLADNAASLCALRLAPACISTLSELDLTGCDSIECDHTELSSSLSLLENLRKVSLDFCHFQPDPPCVVHTLSSLPLRELRLCRRESTRSWEVASALSHIAACFTSLEALTLEGVSSGVLLSLSSLTALTSLDVSRLTDISQASAGADVPHEEWCIHAKHLPRTFPQLRHLSVRRWVFQETAEGDDTDKEGSGSGNGGQFFDAVTRMQSLTSIEVDIASLEEFGRLSDLPHLRSVHVVTGQVFRVSRWAIRVPKEWRSLEISGFQNLEMVSFMVSAARRWVPRLGLYSQGSEIDLSAHMWRGVTELGVDFSFLSGENKASLCRYVEDWYLLASLTRLRLLGAEVDVAAARALSCIHSLEVIDLRGCKVQDGVVQAFVWMPKVKEVLLAEEQRGAVSMKGVDCSKVRFDRAPARAVVKEGSRFVEEWLMAFVG